MKSNHPKTVGSNPVLVQNHPIHPTGTSFIGILCSFYTEILFMGNVNPLVNSVRL